MVQQVIGIKCIMLERQNMVCLIQNDAFVSTVLSAFSTLSFYQ